MSKGPDTVYILKSGRHQARFCTGITIDIEQRLVFHNTGLSRHTATGCPWSVVATIHFADELRAQQFELYLKTGSGRAFAARHFR